MNKQIVVVIALFVSGLIFFMSNGFFNIDRPLTSDREQGIFLPTLTFPTLELPILDNKSLADEAWQVFQDFLARAQAHDLEGVRSLSHQISETCQSVLTGTDPILEEECFALMDNVYNIASFLQREEFQYIESDKNQIVMYTDGPIVASLFFTRDSSGTPKVLGLRFCAEDAERVIDEAQDEIEEAGPCVEVKSLRQDLNNNGWWDSVEEFFNN